MIGFRLGRVLRRLFRGGNDAGATSGLVWSMVFLAAAATAVLVASALYYRNYRADYLRQAESQLRTLAEVKADELRHWREERRGDATVFFRNEHFASLIAEYLFQSSDAVPKSEVRSWLLRVEEAYDYAAVAFFDAEGKAQISTSKQDYTDAPEVERGIDTALKQRRIVFVDHYRAGAQQRIYLGIIAPVSAEQDGRSVRGAVVLVADPETQLYPVMRRWPTRWKSAGIVLARRDGRHHVVVLNDLGFPRRAALSLRVPADNPDSAIAQAASGDASIVEGYDHRGRAVVAATSSVPQSPWFLLAKLDRDELYGPLRARLGGLLALLGGVVAGLVAVGLAAWQVRSKAHYRALYRAEAERRAHQERYRLLFESIRDAILVVDANRRIVDCNPAFTELFGYRLGDIRGKPSSHIYADQADFTAMGETLRANADRPRLIYEIRYQKQDGTVFPGETNVFFVKDEDGQTNGFIALIRDVTGQKEVEAELRQAQKMEAVGRLAGGVAHDFNNMLSVIIGQTELALRGQDSEVAIEDRLVQVKQAAERSAGLTRQLLAVSRHDAGEARVANLTGVIVEHVDMLRRLMSERIELHLDTEASRWNARIDPTELVQILMNLMVNARDAIDDTGVVSLEVRDVVADSALRKHHRDLEASEYVMVSVSDTGSGMDAETRERIFDPFFTTKGATEGSGLGLSTVYGIMRRHGGTVHVYSEPGEGTTFRLYFPRELRESEAHARAEPSEPVTGDERVLLVEDDPAVLKLARAALESQGYEVYAAQSVEEAWRVARQRNGALDLLLTDVIMPAKNGKELAAELRSLQPSLRVLFMSGYADDIVVRGDAGSRDAAAVEEIHLIEKPFTVAGLAAKVREVLEA